MNKTDNAIVSPAHDYRQQFTPLLITGEMRSGTTFVANFLNSQPHCAVYADLLKSWFAESRKLHLPHLSQLLADRQKNVLLSSLIATGWQFGITAFDQIDRRSFDTWLDLFWYSLAALDTRGDSELIGVKATREYNYLPDLLDNGFKVIFCMRDPRDVLLSAKNRFGDYHLYKTALNWRRAYQLAQSHTTHPNFYLLRFEALIEESTREEEVARLSDFLGVTLDTGLNKLVIRDGIEFTSNSSFGDVEKLFDTRVLYRWRQFPDSPEVTFASQFLQKELESLGYEAALSSPEQYRRLYRQYQSYQAKSALKQWLSRIYRRVVGA